MFQADLDGDTSGSAYVFVEDKESGRWEQLRKIQGTGIKAQMGRAVAAQDNFFMVSASHESVEVPSGETVTLANERGSSYIYKISSPDLFQPTAVSTVVLPVFLRPTIMSNVLSLSDFPVVVLQSPTTYAPTVNVTVNVTANATTS